MAQRISKLFAIRVLAAALEGRAVFHGAHATAPQVKASVIYAWAALDFLVNCAAEQEGVSSSGCGGTGGRGMVAHCGRETWFLLGVLGTRFAEIS